MSFQPEMKASHPFSVWFCWCLFVAIIFAICQEYSGQLKLLYGCRYEQGGEKTYAPTR
ncbi:hypothetical protein [Trichormus sp. NMC-1]|uniref:hypothetical protein n=1 Tax=Trichormus sp. NMC-1 TaxID=1853259 RepID=UPI001F3D1343|nr:hypothetical protein [Trichormus sp. NMC-1]